MKIGYSLHVGIVLYIRLVTKRRVTKIQLRFFNKFVSYKI